YLRRLQQRAAEVLGAREPATSSLSEELRSSQKSSVVSEAPRQLFIVVEKILGPDEQLPARWPVHGTTGYEFGAIVNALFVDGRHERAFDSIYGRFVRGQTGRQSFEELVYRSKKLIMHETMSG